MNALDTYKDPPLVQETIVDVDGDQARVTYYRGREFATVQIHQQCGGKHASVALVRETMIRLRDAIDEALDAMSDEDTATEAIDETTLLGYDNEGAGYR